MPHSHCAQYFISIRPFTSCVGMLIRSAKGFPARAITSFHICSRSSCWSTSVSLPSPLHPDNTTACGYEVTRHCCSSKYSKDSSVFEYKRTRQQLHAPECMCSSTHLCPLGVSSNARRAAQSTSLQTQGCIRFSIVKSASARHHIAVP